MPKQKLKLDPTRACEDISIKKQTNHGLEKII